MIADVTWADVALSIGGPLVALLIAAAVKAFGLAMWRRHTALGRLVSKTENTLEESLREMEDRD